MRLLRSLRVQLALIIALSILIPISVIGYYAVVYEVADRNTTEELEAQLTAAAHDMEPLFQGVSGAGVTDGQLTRLLPAINNVLRSYPGIRASYYNGMTLYTFGSLRLATKGTAPSDAPFFVGQGLLVTTPDEQSRQAWNTAIKQRGGVVTKSNNLFGGQAGQQTTVAVGKDKQGLLILESRIGPYWLENRFPRQAVAGSLVLGLLIGLYGILWISHRLQQSISKIKAGLARASEDLAQPLEKQSGELGVVVDAVNRMRQELLDKRSLEEQLQRAERLAGLGQLVAGVAHEIRNPLGIMKGTVQLMERSMQAEPALRQYDEHMHVLEEQIARQNRVVEELLSYARPVKPQFGPVSLERVIESVLVFLAPALRQQGIVLKRNIQANLPDIEGDGEKLKQVFVNLLLNSKEAMPNGGEITIMAVAGPHWLEVQFTDNGPGIAPEHLERLFEPFFSTKEAGTGLGLSIAKQLVEQHNGELLVESEPGKGTCFTIHIPITSRPL